MKRVKMEVIKRFPDGRKEGAKVNLTPLEMFLSPEDFYRIETKLNELMDIRFHITIDEE